MAPRDRLPVFTDDPVVVPAGNLPATLRRLATWMAALTMAAGLVTLGFLLGGR